MIRSQLAKVTRPDKSTFEIVGLMSGTSLDGVDLALCRLDAPTSDQPGWRADVEAATTVPYPASWLDVLQRAHTLTGSSLLRAHAKLGEYFGQSASEFIRNQRNRGDLVASHGHTIFHQPAGTPADPAPLTFQLGHGASLAAACGRPVVCDFRSTDVALGGQGAPLVPLGDRLLFGQYGCCLNLGGIANLSVETRAGGRLAYDVCACNQLFNNLAAEAGLPYDADGTLARQGVIVPALLATLDAPAYLHEPPPKSLGREWIEEHALPLLRDQAVSLPDRMRTAVRHVAGHLARAIREALAQAPPGTDRRVLVTGGGAHHGLLLAELRALLGDSATVVVPDARLVDFKEALIFALLGALRWRGEINTLASATGARRDSVGGAVYLP